MATRQTLDFGENLKTKVDSEQITQMNIQELRQGLHAQRFTSVDLIAVFGQRCQTEARQLCLSAQECFQDALKLA